MWRVVALGQDELLMSSDIARLIGEIDRLIFSTQAAVDSSPSPTRLAHLCEDVPGAGALRLHYILQASDLCCCCYRSGCGGALCKPIGPVTQAEKRVATKLAQLL